jgi:hypothetical protein
VGPKEKIKAWNDRKSWKGNSFLLSSFAFIKKKRWGQKKRSRPGTIEKAGRGILFCPPALPLLKRKGRTKRKDHSPER